MKVMSPTRSAASPSQNRKMPGASTSSPIRMTPKISQFQLPNVANISVTVSSSGWRQHWRNGGGSSRRHRGATRGSRRRDRAFAEGGFRDLADAGERTEYTHGFDRQHDH